MPNQLASTKRRRSLAEHEAVLAALAEIARLEGATVMALLRQAVRDTVRAHAADPAQAARLRSAVMACRPEPQERFASAAQLTRFKRAQREFDDVLLDLQLASPGALQNRNSIIASHCKIRILELEQNHAKRTVA